MGIRRLLFTVLLLLLLVSCSSDEKTLTQVDAQVTKQVELLKNHLTNNRVKNAVLLTQYAKKLKEKKPGYSDIINTMASDASVNGPMYKSLVARLDAVRKQILAVKDLDESTVANLLAEYQSINTASSLNNYNMMLTDSINVLADMSDGTLPRVSAMAREASMAANQSSDMGPGSQLVGNPNYGHWKQRSNGASFWEFYGAYAFFSRQYPRPYSYSYWSSHRDYSYYHDTGRRYYSSPTQKRAQVATETRTKKNFKSQGKSFKSPYAKSKSSGKKNSVSQKKLLSVPSKYSSSGKGSKFSSKYSGSSKPKSKKRSSSYKSRSKTKSRSSGSRGK